MEPMRLKIKKTASGTYYIPSLSIKQLRTLSKTHKRRMENKQKRTDAHPRRRITRPAPTERGTEGARRATVHHTPSAYSFLKAKKRHFNTERSGVVAPMSGTQLSLFFHLFSQRSM